MEIDITKKLPDDEQKVLCYGFKTYCCAEDMEKERDWHLVTFKFSVSSYKLKQEIPDDPEESILEEIKVTDLWVCDDEEGHVIGVTKWKALKK